jgi:hypothetical protein
MLLGATFKRGEDVNVHWQIGCHWEQRVREGRARECPWAKGGVFRKGDVHWQIGVLLEAPLEDGRTRECPWVDSRAVAVLSMSIMVGVVFVEDQNRQL